MQKFSKSWKDYKKKNDKVGILSFFILIIIILLLNLL